MIYKVNEDCILFGIYLEEQQNNYLFNTAIKHFCNINHCKIKDLKIKVRRAGTDYKIDVKNNSGTNIANGFDFSNINAKMLAIAPRNLHDSDINKYLDPETEEALKSPLNYEYFWLDKYLFLEVADLVKDIPIKFRLTGLRPVTDIEAMVITHLRDLTLDLEDMILERQQIVYIAQNAKNQKKKKKKSENSEDDKKS